jgi:hypothetical protein
MLISCYTQKKHHFLYYFFLFLDATSQPFDILRRLTRLTYPHSRFGVVDSLLTAPLLRNTGKLIYQNGVGSCFSVSGLRRQSIQHLSTNRNFPTKAADEATTAKSTFKDSVISLHPLVKILNDLLVFLFYYYHNLGLTFIPL